MRNNGYNVGKPSDISSIIQTMSKREVGKQGAVTVAHFLIDNNLFAYEGEQKELEEFVDSIRIQPDSAWGVKSLDITTLDSDTGSAGGKS